MLRMPCLSRWIMMATMPRCSDCQAHPEPSAVALSGERLGSALLLEQPCYVCLIHQIFGEIQGELISTCSQKALSIPDLHDCLSGVLLLK